MSITTNFSKRTKKESEKFPEESKKWNIHFQDTGMILVDYIKLFILLYIIVNKSFSHFIFLKQTKNLNFYLLFLTILIDEI